MLRGSRLKRDSGYGRKAMGKDLQERIETFAKASSRMRREKD
jgi:hypothetical protein